MSNYLPLVLIFLVFTSASLLMIRLGFLPSPFPNKKNIVDDQNNVQNYNPRQLGVTLPNTLSTTHTNIATHALVIGVNEYTHVYPHYIDFVKKDVEKIASVLENNYYLKNLTLLTGRNAHKEIIMDEIKQTVNRIKEDENIFFYYAGYSFRVEKEGKGQYYFGTFNTNPLDLETTAISTNEFQELFSNEITGRVLQIFNSYRSAYEFKHQNTDVFAGISKLFAFEANRAVLTLKGSRNIRKYHLYNQNTRFFSKYLVEVLNEGIQIPEGVIEVDDLYYGINLKLSKQDSALLPVLYTSSGVSFPLLEVKQKRRQ